MKYLLLFCWSLFFVPLFAQTGSDKVFIRVDPQAGPENQVQWNKFIEKAAALPLSVKKGIPPGNYAVTVKFIVDVHGYIGSVEATSDPGYGLAARMVNAVKQYPGKWHPASQCGRNVKSYYKQTIRFVIADG